MADFITRVELHGAGPADYATLHLKMQELGFQTRILSGDGVAFQLPTAMYVYRANALVPISCDQVRDMAKQAADATGRNSWIITAQASDASWYLNTVKPG